MFAAILTTGLFAATAPIARRAAVLLGPTTANLYRLLLALLLLAGWSLGWGRGGAAAPAWFLASGLAGFGVGGVLMFQALPRAGSNLANLVVQCGSAIVAVLLEWSWLGAQLTVAELGCVAAILVGVIVGIAPHGFPQLRTAQVRAGAWLATLSAIGQGMGAVLSRKAFAVARSAATTVDPGTAAFERVIGGVLVAGAAWCLLRFLRRRREPAEGDLGRAWPWVIANTFAGPVLGVACMQWALSTTPAGIVQPIVATAPLLTAPLAFGLGEALPRARYFAGAAIATGATAALWWFRWSGAA